MSPEIVFVIHTASKEGPISNAYSSETLSCNYVFAAVLPSSNNYPSAYFFLRNQNHPNKNHPNYLAELKLGETSRNVKGWKE
jgi:hypothetical protein